VNASSELAELLIEYRRARAYTDLLWRDLSAEEVHWRPHEQSSAIGWHLGHQAAVAHFMIRNLICAEPSPDPQLDSLMDSATPEQDRGQLPTVERLLDYRAAVADRVHCHIGDIAAPRVSAPRHMHAIGRTLLVAVINHEYQHDQWIAEVRAQSLGHELPPRPESDRLVALDGYLTVSDSIAWFGS